MKPTGLQIKVARYYEELPFPEIVARRFNVSIDFVKNAISTCENRNIKEEIKRDYDCETCPWKCGNRPCVLPDGLCGIR